MMMLFMNRSAYFFSCTKQRRKRTDQKGDERFQKIQKCQHKKDEYEKRRTGGRSPSSREEEEDNKEDNNIEKKKKKMYLKYVQMYKNAVRRHEREAAEFAKEIARIVSNNSASDTSFKKEKKKEGEDKDKEEEEEEEGFVLSPRSRKLLRVGVDGNGRGRQQKQQQREHEEGKRYARVGASQRERRIEIEEEEEEEKNERRRMRNRKRDGTSSLSLLGLAEFTYFTRSALLVAAAKFYDLGGGDSDLTETTTMINGTSSSSSISSNKSDLESIFAVASAHAVLVLISDVLAQKKYIENALDASVSVMLRVFALLLGTAMWFSIAFLFGSSVIASSEKQRATVAFAYFMSSLTVLPGTHAASAQALVRTRNTKKQQQWQQNRKRTAATSMTTVEAIFMPALRVIAFVKLAQRDYLRVVLDRRFRSDFDAFFRATVIGSVLFAWMGGLLAPLDWSTEWHKYPTLSVRLAIIGHILGTVLTAVFAWLDRTLPEKMK
jgi:hypothetical protein